MNQAHVKILFRSLTLTVAVALVGQLLFGSLARAQGPSVSQAISMSQDTGKPIFAVAGASYCPSCVILMNTLNTDESLRPYIEQFVPLKISSESDDYQRWKQFFPPKKSAIPALFIVSPQGKELYSAVGALPTQSLQKVMLSSLEKAGRYPTATEWEEILATLEASNKLLEEQEYEKAADQALPIVEQLSRLGSLLELGTEGRRAQSQVRILTATEKQQFDEALKSMVSKGEFQNAMDVATLEQLLAVQPDQRKQSAREIKQSIRDSAQKKLLKQARELRQAEAMAKDSEKKQQRKALAIFKRIAKRYPNTEAAKRAEQNLKDMANTKT